MEARDFELLLCTHDPSTVRRCVTAGVDGVVLEWEQIDGEDESCGELDPIELGQLSSQLLSLRQSTEAWIICRLQQFSSSTKQQVSAAIHHGADEIWLPKVFSAAEVEATLDIINGQVPLGVVIETKEAVNSCSALANLPLSRVHIGVKDLAVALGNSNPFLAIADGTIEDIVSWFDVPHGFAGLTFPDRGLPIPAKLMMGELSRLNCSFSLLRTSFLSDINNRSVEEGIGAIRKALLTSAHRDELTIESERKQFSKLVNQLKPK